MADEIADNPETNPAPAQGADQTPDENGQVKEAPKQPSAADLEKELAVLKEKYSQSSREGHRLAEDLKSLKAQMEQRDTSRSLTEQNQFPAEEQYVKFWTEQGEKTEKEARMEFRREKAVFDAIGSLRQQQEAIAKMIAFERDNTTRVFAESNPVAKEAQNFCKDFPTLAALPVADQIEHFNKFREKLGIKADGVDKTDLKRAASGSTGLDGSRMAAQGKVDSNLEKVGITSSKALQELQSVESQAEYDKWKAKWKPGNLN